MTCLRFPIACVQKSFESNFHQPKQRYYQWKVHIRMLICTSGRVPTRIPLYKPMKLCTYSREYAPPTNAIFLSALAAESCRCLAHAHTYTRRMGCMMLAHARHAHQLHVNYLRYDSLSCQYSVACGSLSRRVRVVCVLLAFNTRTVIYTHARLIIQ